MGYNTSYTLGVLNGSNELIEDLIEDCDGANYGLDHNGDPLEPVKWYNHEIEIKLFSKAHPKVIFKLSGEGEEAGDLWVKYFKGGKIQICKAIITYEDFDESKLS